MDLRPDLDKDYLLEKSSVEDEVQRDVDFKPIEGERKNATMRF